MKVKFAVAALAAMLLAPVAMSASAQIYINAGLTGYQFDDDHGPTAFTGRVGYDIGQYFAAEGEAGFGIIKDNGYTVESEFGAFALGKLPLSANLHAFGRIGYSFINASDNFEGDGFAWGIGGQYRWGKMGVRAEWTRHENDDESVDGLSLSYVQGF